MRTGGRKRREGKSWRGRTLSPGTHHPRGKVNLVNGEELLVPLDPGKPQGKTMPQAPRLVEIPQF